jgi:hypothetical protein
MRRRREVKEGGVFFKLRSAVLIWQTVHDYPAECHIYDGYVALEGLLDDITLSALCLFLL